MIKLTITRSSINIETQKITRHSDEEFLEELLNTNIYMQMFLDDNEEELYIDSLLGHEFNTCLLLSCAKARQHAYLHELYKNSAIDYLKKYKKQRSNG